MSASNGGKCSAGQRNHGRAKVQACGLGLGVLVAQVAIHLANEHSGYLVAVNPMLKPMNLRLSSGMPEGSFRTNGVGSNSENSSFVFCFGSANIGGKIVIVTRLSTLFKISSIPLIKNLVIARTTAAKGSGRFVSSASPPRSIPPENFNPSPGFGFFK